MRPALRIIDTGLQAAGWNIAMTATLVERRARGEIADTLRFHRYEPSVLIGCGQQAEAAVDLSYCRANGIAVCRRVTGGGAVLMMPDMLAWDVVVGCRGRWRPDQIAEDICTAVAAGLDDLGAGAVFRSPNDIIVAGKKISGSSGHVAGNAAVLQGTVLIDDDTEVMARVLRLPVDALRQSVTCLGHVTTATPPIDTITRRISVRVAEALGCAAAWGAADKVEDERAAMGAHDPAIVVPVAEQS